MSKTVKLTDKTAEQMVYGRAEAEISGMTAKFQYNHESGRKPAVIAFIMQNDQTGFRLDGAYTVNDGFLRFHFQQMTGNEDLSFTGEIYEAVKQILARFAD